MKRTKLEKGITLIALIITIVVLLILAVVAIRAVQGNGIIEYAKNARDDYEQAQTNEQAMLDNYISKIEGSLGGGNSNTTPAEMLAAMEDDMLTKTVNSDITDAYGNKITVPAGFKILVDSTTVYTAEDINVTKGIVITDGTNEFVWIPVGKVYTDIEKTEENAKTITLGRYSSFVKNESGEYVPAQTAANYATKTDIEIDGCTCTEDTTENHGDYKNLIAKSIKDFCLNSIAKGGYYLGRYEAGDLESTEANTARTEETSDENTLVCKANQQVYNYVTQSQASSLSQSMYKDATTYTSDLINSYAWDTAIIFIQTFGNCEDYYNKHFSTSFSNTTGINNDKYCNIYNMSGNAFEFSTETDHGADALCIGRGGYFYEGPGGGAYGTTCSRFYGVDVGTSSVVLSFRPLLYF